MAKDGADWQNRIKQALDPVLRPLAAFWADKRVKTVWDWVKEPLYSIAAVFAFATVIVQPFYVPSGSMQPTLAIGDAVLATKFSYGYNSFSIPYGGGDSTTHHILARMPERGDVVVFRLPINTSINYVKRVIGLPGDRIQMKHGRLWINGKQLPLQPTDNGDVEVGRGNYFYGLFFNVGDYRSVPRFIETLPNGVQHPIYKWQWDGELDDTQEFLVPKDHLFMMGDNRDDSTDSRASLAVGGFGHFVPVGNVVGRAVVVIGSVDFLNAESIFGWIAQFRISRFLDAVR